ncbi:bifunctional phosphopantothenoylcysteine decarboxylase/phosphopantothenate--cysteine ligase CoaBC [Herbiconiux sp. KACC 21604]|uniref:bifunctional phosphopantothenoylcysteine decarboxylase/phosphopantothenate--cysteine ligase CoaBC n=1 Tax=unclassified Herbiconiux TaxID=2618217 RepID=UPI001491ED36|nr:bifunctional phosphopantothenoylcysteine decarboxylase/phosphopantothenate--cysteine ligase CoaBC [Herbiconiux sp. SALV-R1]QJU53601.1 bifunctional phosphopantothenoylcysteine decarboxylase/phosphopantothenate--cysteine ligase CoaBC [Herbiconiux sp. SALV-R1]WPO88582.1 bifunctional phosphopantothenoylcysteine decarboxylase/phosphopantothenate--cysteine ligase CoaBC [Herbiconiux sp. KACC 21604]
MNIVVGITGGIAAYKAVNVIRGLVLAGHDVHVVATEAALRFVGRPTLEALSRNTVNTDLYEAVAEVRHVAIGQAAELVVIAPATANTIAKLAAGIADDLLGNTVLATKAPVVIAPAMHTEMWQNPATVANVELLRSRGVHLVGPVSGQLTGRDSGAGRMAEPDVIVAEALAVASGTARLRDLEGVSVLVTAGGTREPLDPVRYIGNRSSGRQGIALAEAARDRGARVTLVAAHVEVPLPSGVEVVRAETAARLLEVVSDVAPRHDVTIMAAAVSDYRPVAVSDAKIKKAATGERLTLELVQNPDILATISAGPRGGRLVVGFAAETAPSRDELLELGRAKIARKGCDYLVVNGVGWTTGFATDGNEVVVLDAAGDIVFEASGSKMSVADGILGVFARARSGAQ